MKFAIVDIAGTVDEYSLYLSHSLTKMKGEEDDVMLICQTSRKGNDVSLVKLFSLVPARYKRSLSIWKRATKAFETIINYIRVVFYIKLHNVDVVHFQWFPFMELCTVEKYVLIAIKYLSPKTKIVYTHHNLYPHDSSEPKRRAYKKRLIDVIPLIDKFVVHTKTTQNDICEEFGIDYNRVSVQYHGLFYPRESYDLVKKQSDKKRILMYGMQTPYKGTDILVDAIDLLPVELKQNLEVEIVGRLNKDYWDTFREKAERNHIVINPERISNKELYEKISSADYLVYPYRQISQSGALLLGVYFNKQIIPSNLPQFIETLDDFQSDWFFKSESPESLSNLIQRHLNNTINHIEQTRCINKLQVKYSWDTVALKTLEMYHQITKE